MTITRLAAIALLFTVFSGMWDIWWHGAVGRDSFWEPPHLLLYAGIVSSIVIGVYGWYIHRKAIWRNFALTLLAILVSAPVDEFWHRYFGTESPISPLIVWSPPHLILILAVAASLGMLIPLVREERDPVLRWITVSALLGAMLSLLLFLLIPLQPLGFHRLAGFYGAGFVTFLTALVLVAAQKIHAGPLKATIVAAFVLLLSAMLTGESTSVQIIQGIPEHPHPPFWIQIAALITGAASLDLLANRSSILKGSLFGAVYGGLLYTISNSFIELQFQYTVVNTVVAVTSSIVGGVLGSSIASMYHSRSNSKPLKM